jgi:hypothetical protein
MAKRQLVCKSRLGPTAIPTLSSRTPRQASKGEPHPTPSTQLNFRRPDIEVIAFD